MRGTHWSVDGNGCKVYCCKQSIVQNEEYVFVMFLHNKAYPINKQIVGL